MLKFKFLDNQTAVEAKASDHHPIVMGDLCTFNLLCRCKVNAHYTNNGFSLNETIEEYRERLMHKLLPIIRELIEAHHVQIFAFQEAPPMKLTTDYCENERALFEAAQAFYASLKKLFTNYIIDPTYYKTMWKGSDSCGLLLIYNNAYEIEKEITQEIIDSISSKNRLRFQAFQFSKSSNKLTPFSLINIHADFNNQDGTKKDVQNLVVKGFIVAGDFNLKTLPEIKGCSQKVLTTNPGLMPHDTYDGIFIVKN